jgi:hypothetical protein
MFLSESDLDHRWRRRDGFAQRLRRLGRGPKPFRMSSQTFLYDIADVESYEAALKLPSGNGFNSAERPNEVASDSLKSLGSIDRETV